MNYFYFIKRTRPNVYRCDRVFCWSSLLLVLIWSIFGLLVVFCLSPVCLSVATKLQRSSFFKEKIPLCSRNFEGKLTNNGKIFTIHTFEIYSWEQYEAGSIRTILTKLGCRQGKRSTGSATVRDQDKDTRHNIITLVKTSIHKQAFKFFT